MFFIIWGTKTALLWLGFPEVRECSTCKQPKEFQLAVQYRFTHLYYIIGFGAYQIQYWTLCPICKRGWKMDAIQAKTLVPKNPIPFMHRYGWVVPLSILVGLMLWASLVHP